MNRPYGSRHSDADKTGAVIGDGRSPTVGEMEIKSCNGVCVTAIAKNPIERKRKRRSIRLQGYDYSQAGAYYITMASFQSLDPKLSLQLLGIGASRAQLLWLLCREARLPLLAAVMAGFGGVISEVGASMMVGGNIRGQTRVLTTATVLETGRGNFDVAIALSLILLTLTFAINFFLTRIQQREHLRWPRLS